MPRTRQIHQQSDAATATQRPLLADGDELVTVAVAAHVARCSEMTVRRAYRRGELTAYRRSGARAVRLRRSEVEAWALGAQLPSREPEETPVPDPHVLATRAASPRGRFADRVNEALKRHAAA